MSAERGRRKLQEIYWIIAAPWLGVIVGAVIGGALAVISILHTVD